MEIIKKDIEKLKHDLKNDFRRQELIFEALEEGIQSSDNYESIVFDMEETIQNINDNWRKFQSLI